MANDDQKGADAHQPPGCFKPDPQTRWIEDRVAYFAGERWTLGVVGLGYVGLPIAIAAVEAGLHVIGFDVDEGRVQGLERGESHIDDISDERLAEALRSGLRIASDASALRPTDAIFVAVPSPLSRNRQPDMSYIEAASRTIGQVIKPGHLISLESTTYPGTTEEIFPAVLESAGLRLDEDVFVAFSPERVDPGNPLEPSEIPKVVGGLTPASTSVASAAYARLFPKVHEVSSASEAELTKLLENTYRAVNIAMVNELVRLADHLGIDLWEVIDAAATKPFGYQAFYPGPGVGGHCIPLDPQFLAWRAKEFRAPTRFIDLADEINQTMPSYVVSRVTRQLNEQGKPVRRSRVLGIGISYKRNISDARESPSLDVLRLLRDSGAVIGVIDPFASESVIRGEGFFAVRPGDIGFWDIAVVLTDHESVDYREVLNSTTGVLDCRGVYRRLGLTGPVINL